MTAYEKVCLARAKGRPTSKDYILHIFDEFVGMHGDRRFADDKAIIAGVGEISGIPVTVIGIEKGANTKERVERNFGSVHPEGYRKALRLMKMAEKFNRAVASEELNTYMHFVGTFNFNDEMIDNIYCQDMIITPEMEGIISCLNKQKMEYIKEKITEYEYTNELFEGYCVALVYAEKHASEIGYKINTTDNNMDFVAIVDPSKNTISLRSRDGGVDVGEVAKKYGGGGHKNAAGVKYSVMYPRFVFNP